MNITVICAQNPGETAQMFGCHHSAHAHHLCPLSRRPTWLRTSLCCEIPCLIIQDQRLGSASRLSLCCVVHPTETLLGSFLSFNLFCPSFTLPPHGCLPFSVQNLPLPPVSFVLSPLRCSFLPSQPSLLNPPLLGHFLSIFSDSPTHF